MEGYRWFHGVMMVLTSLNQLRDLLMMRDRMKAICVRSSGKSLLHTAMSIRHWVPKHFRSERVPSNGSGIAIFGCFVSMHV